MQRQPSTTVFTGGTVIDGTGADPIGDGVVIVQGDTIIAVGPRSEVKIPEGARAVDVTGSAVLPGLADCHTHLTFYRANGKGEEQKILIVNTNWVYRAQPVPYDWVPEGTPRSEIPVRPPDLEKFRVTPSEPVR